MTNESTVFGGRVDGWGWAGWVVVGSGGVGKFPWNLTKIVGDYRKLQRDIVQR